MKCSIILIGTELLNGMTVDTNSIFIAEELNRYGIEIKNKLTVGDEVDEIISSIEFCKKNSDLVILTGGLGPTIDDVTKEAIGKYLGKKLIIEEEDVKKLKAKFERIKIEFIPSNYKEVEKPEGSLTFKNEVGMADGIYIDGISAFPGVPRELYHLFPKFLKWYIEEKNISGEIIIEDLLVYGIPESKLEEMIIDTFTSSHIKYEFLVKDYGIIIRLLGQKKDKKVLNEIKENIKLRIGSNLISEDGLKLEEVLVKKLLEKNLTISLAESCTGGKVASKLIGVSGVSKVLTEGLVTYSNEAKVRRLAVENETLKEFGAVSKETCQEMLKGLDSHVAIAITGIAGPNGGTEEKPVGTVFIGIKYLNEIKIERHLFMGTREKVRDRATNRAIFNLINEIRGGKNVTW